VAIKMSYQIQPQLPRRILQTNCGKCNADIYIDVTDFEPNMTITNNYRCRNGHEVTVSVRNGRIILITPLAIESDIDDYTDVPLQMKILIKEAYKCSVADAPVAGACVIRRLLDELLYELGFTRSYLGRKITAFETRCNNDQNFRTRHDTLFRRLEVFRTIAKLSSYHAHAQERPIVDVIKSEFEEYLHVVEGAIKEKWPNRRNP